MDTQNDNTERMEFMVTEIHAFLRSEFRHNHHFHPAPYYFEFTGPPDSGKSSAIKSAYMYQRRHQMRVKKPLEGAEEFSDDIPRSSPEFNLATGIYALNFFALPYHAHTHDVILLDRGIVDAYMQMKSWRKKGKLSEREMRSYQDFFLSRFWAPRLTHCYIMICDPEVSIERTKEEARTEKLGGSTTPESIALMRQMSIETYEELKDKLPLTLVDTSALTKGEVADMINCSMLEQMLARARTERKNRQ